MMGESSIPNKGQYIKTRIRERNMKKHNDIDKDKQMIKDYLKTHTIVRDVQPMSNECSAYSGVERETRTIHTEEEKRVLRKQVVGLNDYVGSLPEYVLKG